MLKFIGGIFLFAYYIAAGIYSGFVFSTLWGWFAVPLGFPVIGVAHAIGLLTVLSYPLIGVTMKLEAISESEFSFEHYVSHLFKGLAVVSIALGYGWIVHRFM